MIGQKVSQVGSSAVHTVLPWVVASPPAARQCWLLRVTRQAQGLLCLLCVCPCLMLCKACCSNAGCAGRLDGGVLQVGRRCQGRPMLTGMAAEGGRMGWFAIHPEPTYIATLSAPVTRSTLSPFDPTGRLPHAFQPHLPSTSSCMAVWQACPRRRCWQGKAGWRAGACGGVWESPKRTCWFLGQALTNVLLCLASVGSCGFELAGASVDAGASEWAQGEPGGVRC